MNTQPSNISRWVAFLLLPLATAVAAVVSVKARAWFGIDLPPGGIVAFILSVGGGIATWLFNRGRWEIAHHFGQPVAHEVDGIVDEVLKRLPPPPAATQTPAPMTPTSAPPPPAAGGPGGLTAGQ